MERGLGRGLIRGRGLGRGLGEHQHPGEGLLHVVC